MRTYCIFTPFGWEYTGENKDITAAFTTQAENVSLDFIFIYPVADLS